ncbi:unnamed protein product [Zymoseptoria tritici ST99CH_3D7]|uniref:Ubiquitin-like domain-containing protein n=1 Tax=Zymoseptoria tritici (strain ST99CH_3D7) TaxID=1276538 RepID=A0A1X7RPJ0_ZYMT9|nr:unnamed protein product [Zymoseptoria tritici ST99CH_3D7]
MSGNMTVWEVKLMLQARGGVPAKQIVLFHKGDGQLPDDATVKEVGVRPGDFMTWSDIHTLLRVGHPEPEED